MESTSVEFSDDEITEALKDCGYFENVTPEIIRQFKEDLKTINIGDLTGNPVRPYDDDTPSTSAKSSDAGQFDDPRPPASIGRPHRAAQCAKCRATQLSAPDMIPPPQTAINDDLETTRRLQRTQKLLSDAKSYLNRLSDWKMEMDWENATGPLDYLSGHPLVRNIGQPDTISEAVSELRKDIRQAGYTTDEAHIPLVDFAAYIQSLERAKREDKLARPPIRPVLDPVPGGLPFKHDPVARFAEYKAEWERRPAPGATPHRDLRWKVREYMTRIDLPQMVPNMKGLRLN